MSRTVLLAHSYFLTYDSKQVRKQKPYPPLATLITASVLRDRGWEVVLFDAMLSPGVEEFLGLVQRTRPQFVGLLEDNFNFLTKMCTTRMRQAAFDMIGAARAVDARVVVNGPDASDVPDLYLDAGAEAVIIGETEVTVVDVLEAFLEGRDLSTVAGLVLPDDPSGQARRTPPRTFLEDLDALPFPAWDLVDVDRYRRAWLAAHGRLSWNMVSTRGCPFECNWCAKPLYGQRYAQRSPEDVAEEMLRLKRQVGPDHVWFADDIFGLSPRWVERFADGVERRGAQIPFTIQSRVDLMTPSACAALARAGAEEVWLGVETGSQLILDAMEKNITVGQARTATRSLRAEGVRPSWFLLLGYPGEGWADILATRNLVRDEAPHDVGVSVSYPLPGTPFYAAVEEQLRDKTNWTDSDDLAMLFQGTYTTPLYRRVRDLLHDEAEVALLPDPTRSERQRQLDARWRDLFRESPEYRSTQPTTLPAVTDDVG